jgi:hypothetical protein
MTNPIVIDEDDLEDVYLDLVDATEAAATGNPNECASKAADAKAQVLDLHENATTLEEIGAVDDA